MRDPIPGSEIKHFEQMESACDDGLPTPIQDIDLEQQWEADHAELLDSIEDYKEKQHKCSSCSYGKGSIECLNCFVGGY